MPITGAGPVGERCIASTHPGFLENANDENVARRDGRCGRRVIRRDILAIRGSAKDSGKGGYGTDMQIELEPADHEEPTWEVHHPGDTRRRRLTGRTKSILIVAGIAAVVVNAGAAWAYWRITGSATGSIPASAAVELTVRARSDLNRPLQPGHSGGMTVTVTNDYEFPIRITTVARGPGAIVADDEHRAAGCRFAGVEFAQRQFAVRWEVPRNTIGAFAVPKVLTMRADADPACAGAMFTVPIRVSGVRRDGS